MKIISREAYNHPGPLGPAMDMSRITGIDFHHTASSNSSNVLGDIKQIADFTYNKFGRSSYNFVNHPGDASNVYEMQGRHIGAHNDGENSTRIGFCFFGYYHSPVNNKLSAAQVEAAAQFMAHAHKQWGVPLHAKGHRDTDGTSCPGDYAYSRIDDIVNRAKEIVKGGTMNSDQDARLKRIESAVLGEGSGLYAILSLLRKVRATQLGQSKDLNTLIDRDGADVDVNELANALKGELGDTIANALGQKLVA